MPMVFEKWKKVISSLEYPAYLFSVYVKLLSYLHKDDHIIWFSKLQKIACWQRSLFLLMKKIHTSYCLNSWKVTSQKYSIVNQLPNLWLSLGEHNFIFILIATLPMYTSRCQNLWFIYYITNLNYFFLFLILNVNIFVMAFAFHVEEFVPGCIFSFLGYLSWGSSYIE